MRTIVFTAAVTAGLLCCLSVNICAEEGRCYFPFGIEAAGGISGEDMVLAVSKGVIYMCDDQGKVLEKTPGLPYSGKAESIAVAGGRLFLLSEGKLFTGKYGGVLEKIPLKNEFKGLAAGATGDREEVLAWTDKDMYLLDGADIDRIALKGFSGKIEDALLLPEGIAVLAEGTLYIKRKGNSLRRKRFYYADRSENPAEETAGEVEKMPFEGKLAFSKEAGIALLEKEGLHLIGREGEKKGFVPAMGLFPREKASLACAGRMVLLALDGRLYTLRDNEWQEVFLDDRSPGCTIRLVKHIGDGGKERVLVLCGKHYRIIEAGPGKRTGFPAGGPVHCDNAPSIKEVQRMAVEYAEVSPEKIRRWREMASWKALLPEVSLGFSESTDDNIEIYKNSTKHYVVTGPRETGQDWKVDLSWDLSELVWSSAQTSIDVRSRLMVQLREDILEEVTRLYFERERLLAGQKNKDVFSRSNRLKIREINAYIDALTGGEFTKAME
ncbi:MAG: hypothetical protein GF408_03475 [Candidatus Omnitrophica bacterium]|nr:hypothetical protein [Candidatus Omnitrophota bacterium]